MIRFHGNPPCPIAVVHGGPGGIGSAAALAEELRIRLRKSVAEPLQSQNSIHALTDELCTQIQQPELENPLLLIGHSWGAWLAAFAAERCPERIRRLILIGCPPLRKKEGMEAVRLGRLPQDSRIRCRMLKNQLLRTRGEEQNKIFRELAHLCDRADLYEPADDLPDETFRYDAPMYFRVWGEAELMRSSGALETCFRNLSVPVTMIHGDYDPHPAEGVFPILRESGKCSEFHLLKRCGHTPWREKYAREEFFRILAEELER